MTLYDLSLKCENCIYDNILSMNNGNAINITDTIELINCIFNNICSNNSGGSIHIYNEIDILILNSNFSNTKYTNGNGGSVYFKRVQ